MDDGWYEEAMAASRTIDRMARQMSIFRRALEKISGGAKKPMGIAYRALLDGREIDKELWKRIPHEGKVR